MTAHPLSVANHSRGVRIMLLSAVCFSANALIIRALGTVQAVDVWLLVCVRFVIGLALILAVFRVGPESFQPRNLVRRPLIWRGVVGAIGVYTYYLSLVHLGAGRATFINSTYITMGAMLAALVLHERFRFELIAGGILSLAGLGLITNVFVSRAGISWYDFVAVVSALSSAFVVVTIRRLHAAGEHTSTIFAAQCTYGLLLCSVPAIVNWAMPSPLALALMAVAALCSGGGQIFMTHAFRELPVGEGSLLQMLVPLGIAVGGAVFFREHFAPHELIGAALILGGTALPALRKF
ncbi:MAG: DMT family transporter [Opitutaceae bacterium]